MLRRVGVVSLNSRCLPGIAVIFLTLVMSLFFISRFPLIPPPVTFKLVSPLFIRQTYWLNCWTIVWEEFFCPWMAFKCRGRRSLHLLRRLQWKTNLSMFLFWCPVPPLLSARTRVPKRATLIVWYNFHSEYSLTKVYLTKILETYCNITKRWNTF